MAFYVNISIDLDIELGQGVVEVEGNAVSGLGFDYVEEGRSFLYVILAAIYRGGEIVGGHAPAEIDAVSGHQVGFVHDHRVASGDVAGQADDAGGSVTGYQAGGGCNRHMGGVGEEGKAVYRFTGGFFSIFIGPVLDRLIGPSVGGAYCLVFHLLVIHKVRLGSLVVKSSVSVVGEDAETAIGLFETVGGQFSGQAGLCGSAFVHVDAEVNGLGVARFRILDGIVPDVNGAGCQ